MSSSEGTKDRSSDGAQDGKVDWLRIQVDCQVDLRHFSPEGQAVEQARRGHSCQDACFRMISIVQYKNATCKEVVWGSLFPCRLDQGRQVKELGGRCTPRRTRGCLGIWWKKRLVLLEFLEDRQQP